MTRITVLALLFAGLSLSVSGQGKVDEKALPMTLFQFQFGGYVPFGDMAEMYGPFGSGGISVGRKTESNFIFGADFNYFFGTQVHDADTRFSELRFENGMVLGNEGEFIDVIVQKRGFAAGFYGGKIFNVFGPNPNSGLEIRLGVNFLEHRTWIESRMADIPPLEGEYRKGYDRKRAGFAAYQFIGYRNFSNSRFANFFVGVDFYQAFTVDYRTYNIDEMEFTDGEYFDFIVGIKAGWVIPIYKQLDERFYVK